MPERTKEESVKDRIKSILKEKRVHFNMPPANGYGKSGNFDFVCCVRGLYLGIEAKRDAKEPPTQLQTDNALACIEAGGVALLIHKDNLGLIGKTIDVMKHGNAPSYWPLPAAPPIDNDVKVLKKAKS